MALVGDIRGMPYTLSLHHLRAIYASALGPKQLKSRRNFTNLDTKSRCVTFPIWVAGLLGSQVDENTPQLPVSPCYKHLSLESLCGVFCTIRLMSERTTVAELNPLKAKSSFLGCVFAYQACDDGLLSLI